MGSGTNGIMNDAFSEKELLDFKVRAIQDGADSFFSYLSAHRDAQAIVYGYGWIEAKKAFYEAVDRQINEKWEIEFGKLEGR